MAVNFSGPACGFHQRGVVDFINKQILRHEVSPLFPRMQICESWDEMEKKLQHILTDSAFSGAMKESCAWKALARALQLAEKQKQEDAEKVNQLQNQLDEQKLFTDALVGMVEKLRESQEREKQDAQLQLQKLLTLLHGVERDRDALRSEVCRWSARRWMQGGNEAEGRKVAPPLGMPAFPRAATANGTWQEAGRGPGQVTAASPGSAALGRQVNVGKGISVWQNEQPAATLSRPEGLQTWAQAARPLPLNPSQPSQSLLPAHFPPRAAANAAAVPLVKYPTASWKGKCCPPRSSWRRELESEPSLSYSAELTIKRVARCRARNWDCAHCLSRNFSRYKVCFKCNKSPPTKESGGSCPQ